MKKLLSIAVLFLFLFTACDKCSDVECLNGGTCDKGECVCSFEWEGDKCEIKTLTKHMGEYSMNVQFTTVFNDTYEIELFPDATDPKKFYIGDPVDGIVAMLTSRTEFTIPQQDALLPDFDDPESFTEYPVNGSGSFTVNGFAGEMTVQDDNVFTLTLTATKL